MRDGELGAEEAGWIYDAAALLSRLFVLFLFGSGEGVHDDLSVRVWFGRRRREGTRPEGVLEDEVK